MAEVNLPAVEIVIFGIAGDLTWRKLIPALYNLYLDRLMPEKFAILGVDGKTTDLAALRKRLLDGVNQFSRRGPADEAAWKEFAQHLVDTVAGDFNDAGTYQKLAGLLTEQEKNWAVHAERVFYLATPPEFAEAIVQHLGEAHLVRDRERSRVVFEKPFGHDLESARELNQMLLKTLDESQIYRIDHYLGKETVQNMLAFRFANALFEPIWDRRYIDHVQITVAEQVGVEHRGGYYEHAGALRDMIQNHLLQIVCLIAMEPPVAFNADEIRARKVDVLRAIRPIPKEHLHEYASRGQYGPGWIEGNRVIGYRQEPGVSPDSNTETFAALKLFIDNWRWQDIPFYLRTGKRLPQKISQVIIQFRPVPHHSFPLSANQDWQPNRIEIQIQPDEGIDLYFQAKSPGIDLRLSTQVLRFRYSQAFHKPPPEAYETLLLDTMRADATLFMRDDQVESAWGVIAPVLEAWTGTSPDDFPNYQSGTWGPESAEALIAQDGRRWLQHLFID